MSRHLRRTLSSPVCSPRSLPARPRDPYDSPPMSVMRRSGEMTGSSGKCNRAPSASTQASRASDGDVWTAWDRTQTFRLWLTVPCGACAIIGSSSCSSFKVPHAAKHRSRLPEPLRTILDISVARSRRLCARRWRAVTSRSNPSSRPISPAGATRGPRPRERYRISTETNAYYMSM